MSEYYISWNRDKNTIMDSSSGGVFSALAEYVLDRKGVVFGVQNIEGSTELRTTYIEQKENLWTLRKSKYYQANVDGAMLDVYRFLKNGRFVLFSGTPCQNAGLISYLCVKNINQEEWDRLITVDVLCHGISNVYVFNKYIESIEEKKHKKVIAFYFRDKENGWRQSSCMKRVYEDGSYEKDFWQDDAFFMAYNNNLILRPSCYTCGFSNNNRCTDFSIGDYWGYSENDLDEETVRRGLGLTLVNTRKAEQLWKSEEFQLRIKCQIVSHSLAIRRNGALVTPAIPHSKRNLFFEKISSTDFQKLVRTCLKIERYKIKVKKVLGVQEIRKQRVYEGKLEESIDVENNQDIIKHKISNIVFEKDNPIELVMKKENCYGCFSCKMICPQEAISFESDDEGFIYPQVDSKKCIRCGKCVKSCPKRVEQR